MKILKNTTNVSIVILGAEIPALGSYTIPPQDYLTFASSNILMDLIDAEDIILNDGISDLNKEQSLAYIKYSNFAESVRFLSSPERNNGFIAKNIQEAIEEAKTESQQIALGVAPITYSSTATNQVSTTSSTFSNIANMTLTPPAGKYFISFSGSADTTGVNTQAEFRLVVSSTQVSGSVRSFRNTTNILGLITLSTNNSASPTTITAFVTLNGSQSINAQFRHISGGSVRVENRSLIAIRTLEEGDVIAQLPQPPTASHSALQNLDNDDHLQYLRTDGARSLTGNFNVNNNQIQNVSTINGIAPQAHGSRHNPGGDDPITTGAAQTLLPDQSNAEGTALSVSRSDHIHNVPTAAAVTIDANSTNTQGNATTFSRSNHTHVITKGPPVTITPDQANAEGNSAGFSRANHVHNIPTASAVTISTSNTNTQGNAATFARSNHTHKVELDVLNVIQNGEVQTTSTNDVLLQNMTLTPSQGTYLLNAGTTFQHFNASRIIFFSIYVGGVQIANTLTEMPNGSNNQARDVRQSWNISIPISVNGSQSVEIRWRTSSNTARCFLRYITLLRLT